MELFKRIKETLKYAGLKGKGDQEPIRPIETDYKSRDKGQVIKIWGIIEDRELQHANGERTQLILAKAIKLGKNDAVPFNLVQDIAFELPARHLPNSNALQVVASQFERQIERQRQMNDERCLYLGILDYTKDGYNMTRYSPSTKAYIEQQIDPGIRAKSEIQRRQVIASNQESERRSREALYKESLNAKGYMDKMNSLYEQRKSNPYLQEVRKNKVDGKSYWDYNGINLQTGEILKIRQLDKIGKIKDLGIYLYMGYVNSTPNEYDTERFEEGRPDGIPVCFELPKRFSDIAREQRPQEIRSVLELLSNARNYSRDEGLVYLGEIDKNWTVSFRTKSIHLQKTVDKLKSEFRNREGKPSKGIGYGE